MTTVIPRPGDDPVRTTCPTCGAAVLRAHLVGGTPVLADAYELGPDERPDGLLLAIDESGRARPFRWPGQPAAGEAIHLPHDPACQR